MNADFSKLVAAVESHLVVEAAAKAQLDAALADAATANAALLDAQAQIDALVAKLTA